MSRRTHLASNFCKQGAETCQQRLPKGQHLHLTNADRFALCRGVLLLAYEHPDELPVSSLQQPQQQQQQPQQPTPQLGWPLSILVGPGTAPSSSSHTRSNTGNSPSNTSNIRNTSSSNSSNDVSTGLSSATGRTVSYAVVRPPPDSLTRQIKALARELQANSVFSALLGFMLGGHPGTGLAVGSEVRAPTLIRGQRGDVGLGLAVALEARAWGQR